MNLFGIGLALTGVVIYNQIHYYEKKQKLSLKSTEIQPTLASPLP